MRFPFETTTASDPASSAPEHPLQDPPHPEITFWTPPSKSQLLEVASEWKGVHSRLTWEELLDVATLLQVKVSHEDIGTSSKDAQASLTPRPEGGWLARIDPEPTPFEERTDTCSAAGRSAFCLAHEFGHIYFSDRRCIPHKPVNSYWHASPYNSDEEEYCDQLAGLALVGPEAAHCETAAEVVYAAQELDVPVAAMVNALSVYREHAAGLFHVPTLGYEWQGPFDAFDAPVLRKAVDSCTDGVGFSLRVDGEISSIELPSYAAG